MEKTARIRQLNDQFRTTFTPGRVVFTKGVLERTDPRCVIERVKSFDKFDADNDPQGEHDFGAFSEGPENLYWKIDYYGQTLDTGSEDPADPEQTTRVLTIMLAEEY